MKKILAASFLITVLLALASWIIWLLYVWPLQEMNVSYWYEYIIAVLLLTIGYMLLGGVIVLFMMLFSWCVNQLSDL